jgi:hypothetical protein
MNSRGGMFVERAELAKSIEAGIMAVVPGRLKRVTADETEAAEFKAVRAVADVGALNYTHHVRLAPARRARAGAPELFQGDVAFLAIAPGQREFLADDFDVKGMESHFLTKLTKFRQEEHEAAEGRQETFWTGLTRLTRLGSRKEKSVESISTRSCASCPSCLKNQPVFHPVNLVNPV